MNLSKDVALLCMYLRQNSIFWKRKIICQMYPCNDEDTDRDIIQKFLSDKPFLVPILSDDSLPVLSQQKDCAQLFDFIRSKKAAFKQQNLSLENSYSREMKKTAPKFLPSDAKLIFSQIKFLNLEIFNILISINHLKEENINKIYKGIKSFARFSLVFPFILKKLIVEPQTLERVFSAYSTEENQKKIVELTYHCSQIRNKVSQLSKTLQIMTAKQIPEFNYTTSTYQNSDLPFVIFIENLPSETKEAVNLLISNVINTVNKADNEEQKLFIFKQSVKDMNSSFTESFQTLTEDICQYIGLSYGKKTAQKIGSFLSRYIFYEVYSQNIDPFPSKIFSKEINRSVHVSDLPIKDIITDIEESLLVSEYVSSNEILREAKTELEALVFENCPIDILIRVDYIVKLVQKFISDVMEKQTGSIPSFVPFDNVIQIFNTIFTTAEIPCIASIAFVISHFAPYNSLPNDLAFAHDTLLGAYSLIN